jgi:hypothetical protein
MIDINVGLALLTTVASAGAMIFYGGRQVGRVETAIVRLANLEIQLTKIPKIETDIAILQEIYEKNHSDFRQLQNKVERISEGMIRGKLASQHENE